MPSPAMSHRRRVDERFVSLFWRLFVPNVAVLLAAGTLLWLEPANGRPIALAGGVLAMVLVNVLLMRRAFAPLVRLTLLMERIDPLRPGDRLPDLGPESEVSLLTRSFNAMLDRLERERRDSARRELGAQERERARIARELHDEVGQNLTALAMLLTRLADDGDEGMSRRLLAARESTLGTVDDVRRIARQLRPDLLDELGLSAALATLCERMSENTGLRINRDLPGELPALSPEVETVLYRVAQESLTNVARHAQAREAHLSLRPQPDGGVMLRVADDGVGLGDAAPAGRSGIRGMRERALLAGGELRIDSGDGAGTTVTLYVPRSNGERS
jgi:two-component system sensor histidine kinase UhpB